MAHRHRIQLRCRFFSCLIFCVQLLGSFKVSADNTPPPEVLFLSIATNPDRVAVEKNITDRIVLTLHDFSVTTVSEGLESFRVATLSDQLDLLKQIKGATDAVATVWVEQGSQRVLLNLVAFSTGQALVRIIEAKEGPDLPDTLALTVQELLGQAYLFQNEPLDEELRRTVETVNKAASVAKEQRGEIQKTPKQHKSVWQLFLSAGTRGGMASFQGSSLRFAGNFGILRQFENRIFLTSEARFLLGPKQIQGEFFISSLGGGVSVGIGYQLRVRRFSISPRISGGGVIQRTDVGIVGQDIKSPIWFNGDIDVQFTLQ